MTERSREDRLEELLSEGLDLCVRARKLDAIDRRQDTLAVSSDPKAWQDSGLFDKHIKAHNEQFPNHPIATKSATPALWMQDQYEKDLADWEKRARDFLLYGTARAHPGEALMTVDQLRSNVSAYIAGLSMGGNNETVTNAIMNDVAAITAALSDQAGNAKELTLVKSQLSECHKEIFKLREALLAAPPPSSTAGEG